MNLAEETWEAFRDANPDLYCVTEHAVGVGESDGHMVKIAIPPKFGLIPKVLMHPVPNLRGKPAKEREIEQHFLAAGWTRITDPTGQHLLFFNHAFQTLAIDALPRNCYLKDGDLLPFDVILCQPDAELEAFLGLYDH